MAAGVLAAGALVVGALLTAAPAGAARHHQAKHAEAETKVSTETLGTAGAWSAYVAHDRTGRVCYLAGQPQKSDAAGVPRHQPLAMVTHRPAEHVADVVSFVEGYPLKRDSKVTVAVGERKFELFTEGDSAWAKTSDLDRTIVAALAKGTSTAVKGQAENGRATSDIYSLGGFSKALALIDKACGVNRTGAVLPTRHRVSHQPHRRPEHHVRTHKAHAAHKQASP
jgi:hypothetical protein